MKKVSYFKSGTVADAANTILTFPSRLSGMQIIVDDSTKATVEITIDATPASGSLWSEIDLTNNGARVDGLITGVRISASGADVDYTISCEEG